MQRGCSPIFVLELIPLNVGKPTLATPIASTGVKPVLKKFCPDLTCRARFWPHDYAAMIARVRALLGARHNTITTSSASLPPTLPLTRGQTLCYLMSPFGEASALLCPLTLHLCGAERRLNRLNCGT